MAEVGDIGWVAIDLNPKGEPLFISVPVLGVEGDVVKFSENHLVGTCHISVWEKEYATKIKAVAHFAALKKHEADTHMRHGEWEMAQCRLAERWLKENG